MKRLLILLVAGILSTLIMDIGSGLSRAMKINAGAPPELVGKWIESALKGNLFVGDIRSSEGDPASVGRFLLYHYIIGILLTALFYAIIIFCKINPVPWWGPFAFGFATTLIPLLLMFPGMGFGIFGLKGPQEYLLLRTAILNHLFFGIGLTLTFRFLWYKIL